MKDQQLLRYPNMLILLFICKKILTDQIRSNQIKTNSDSNKAFNK